MQPPSSFAKPRRRGPIAILLLMLLLAIATSFPGCGKRHRELAPLTGKVIYKGKPLRFGTVVVEHEYGQPATGAIQPDGTFVLTTRGEGEGTAVTKSRVRVACYEGQDPDKKAGPGQLPALGRSLIPEKYTSFETSGLTIEVHPRVNEPVVLNLR
ncbi:MAG: hypothetical protein U9N87_13175, partial [Planctomycetota bacterium]|nr:hypothetical protein [Planctomycetota bacterium]